MTADPTPTERARALLDQRHARAQAFASVRDLFHDPAWDILLTLFVAEDDGAVVANDDFVSVSGLSADTVRRWLMVLERQGLIAWLPDPARAELTDAATAMMLRFLRQV